ncbi:ketosteroid isomerase-like protein [Lysobacter niabensis]|uniref:Ketosteroid isomerase-like protein n=1 Tax=Agrilutibacter niabensis TaxID=380628 RepID=A0ABU1VMB5_9GAMM|nr:nuclear transport factor 2 family protein [Lysobacter niabensis]MDR7098622.1 ketosteroid isomerase-like protein [Lysobacter niabensis]
MRRLLPAAFLALVAIAPASAFARSSVPVASVPVASVPAPSAPAAGANASASPAAREAAQVVDAFMTALASGQLDSARQLMAPHAVVIANGHVLGERDAYIDGAAKADAAALGSVPRELLRRDARAGSDVAWVLSEKRLHTGAAQGPSEVVVESMVLARTTAGWKITHIHWSGRHG